MDTWTICNIPLSPSSLPTFSLNAGCMAGTFGQVSPKPFSLKCHASMSWDLSMSPLCRWKKTMAQTCKQCDRSHANILCVVQIYYLIYFKVNVWNQFCLPPRPRSTLWAQIPNVLTKTKFQNYLVFIIGSPTILATSIWIHPSGAEVTLDHKGTPS